MTSRRRVAATVVAMVMSLAACTSDDTSSSPTTSTSPGVVSGAPADDSAEAGFARDMSVHHAQAVAMAEAIRDRTQDPDLKILATDIALGQQAQIGRMSGWLDEWGLSQTSTRTPMVWMRSDNVLPGGGSDMSDMAGMHDGGSMALLPDGRMPGMATRPQVNALSTLPVDQAEISFLQLMIAHHRAGVEMAQAALARTTRADVVRLATSIINGQQSEIDVMTDMLAKRAPRRSVRSDLEELEVLMDETAIIATDADVTDTAPLTDGLVEDELLVEEISIDGMCGVY